MSLMKDVARLKAALICHVADDDDRNELMDQLKTFEEEEEFEEFCRKLDEKPFRDMFVS